MDSTDQSLFMSLSLTNNYLVLYLVSAKCLVSYRNLYKNYFFFGIYLETNSRKVTLPNS